MLRWRSPLCLVLALVSLILGFAMIFSGRPEPGIELHRARVNDEGDRTQALERRLRTQRIWKGLLVAGLFGSSIMFTVAAFRVMAVDQARQR